MGFSQVFRQEPVIIYPLGCVVFVNNVDLGKFQWFFIIGTLTKKGYVGRSAMQM